MSFHYIKALKPFFASTITYYAISILMFALGFGITAVAFSLLGVIISFVQLCQARNDLKLAEKELSRDLKNELG